MRTYDGISTNEMEDALSDLFRAIGVEDCEDAANILVAAPTATVENLLRLAFAINARRTCQRS
jgi:hypothetical protein